MYIRVAVTVNTSIKSNRLDSFYIDCLLYITVFILFYYFSSLKVKSLRARMKSSLSGYLKE